MKTSLHVLMVEDEEDDARLIVRELTRGGYEVTAERVETLDDFRRALERHPWQLVLSDHALPLFSGEVALRMIKESGRDIPFIFVSGTIGEEVAVQSMKAGAHDYVMKGNLARLVPAIARELRDAMERKQHREAAESLRTSEERLSTVFHLSPTPICIVRVADNRFVDVNEAFCKGTGYHRDELIGKTPDELRLWVYPEERTAILQEVREKGRAIACKLRGRRKTGEIGVGLSSMTLIPLNGEAHLLWLILDVTELERAEEGRHESDQRFRQLAENIDKVFWLIDAETNKIIYISPAYQRVWGRSCDSVSADPLSSLELVHAEDRERVRKALEVNPAGNRDLEYRIVQPDGAICWINARTFPVMDANGKPYRIAGVATNITGRRQLEDQFRQAQKMEAVGQLASGIAHDFNNLLTVIQMQSSLLLDAPSDASQTKAGIQQIMGATERAANLTRQLLTFSRRSVREARDIDLGDVTKNMTKLMQRLLGENITVETRIARALPLINADAGMMEQVVMNLVVNARDAMPQGGRLLISVELVKIDDAFVSMHPQARAGNFVCLAVSDTGCGIPPENVSRIFEPFFTTKDIGKGTGLGLATVFGIVEQHHGWITVKSEVNQGSTFQIFLPAPETTKAPTPVSFPEPVVRGGTETILLVEDEPFVRELARAVLERYGYRVLEAGSAIAALHLWKTRQFPVDLLLTDLIMPGGVSGRDLAEQLQAKQPKLKIIYTSGYSNDVVNRTLRLDPGRNFLRKPCSAADLAAIVRHALDEA